MTFLFGCNSIELKCEFRTENWWIIGSCYHCRSENNDNLIIDRWNREIHAMSGSHTSSNKNDNVLGVNIRTSKVFYFPLEMTNIFKNLKGITIWRSKLKELRKEDLKEYRELVYLDLYGNEIQVLEKNLFIFNPKLEALFLGSNSISHIDPHTFDDFINKLAKFYLYENVCDFFNYWERLKVNAMIEKIQTGTCQNQEKLNEFMIGTIPVEILNYLNSKIDEIKKNQPRELANLKSGGIDNDKVVRIEGKLNKIEKTGLERQTHLESIVNDLVLKCKVLQYKVGYNN